MLVGKAKEIEMSCHNREQLEQMLEDVVNELDLSDAMIAEHGPLGTPPAQLVRLVLDQKDKIMQIQTCDCGEILPTECPQCKRLWES